MKQLFRRIPAVPIMLLLCTAAVGGLAFAYQTIGTLEKKVVSQQRSHEETKQTLAAVQSVDQYVKNKMLEATISAIEKTYGQTVTMYEEVLSLKELTKEASVFDASISGVLALLSNREYASASAVLDRMARDTKALRSKRTTVAPATTPVNVSVDNSLPGGGYRRQWVKTDYGTYLVDVIAADLSSTRAIVDSASEKDCSNDCPTLPLSEYVSRNGGYAGINGSYFCPAQYPSCDGKKNSFDTLLMNKNKVYFNSSNNVYSTVPAVIFLGNSVRFVAKSLEWGRDTSPDGVLANQPLLLMGSTVQFGGDGDPKKGSKGSRSFVGSKGTTLYIGVVHGAGVAEVAHALKAMGVENAINLDSGGSTALWYNGYKVGPGRNIPNAIVLVRK
ncbi:phosphodiester glycosidase family protein [Candidatus Gottesmanbacteria bacterium]|nr:phosphodiester glycosidase family protein [Candidatus Gottesmanbacteria bacterium]